MNKKYLYIIISLLAIVILCLLTYKTSEKVVFNGNKETMVHDFGILDKNKTPIYEYNFKYINTKYDSLKIYGVRDGCDCTESEVKRDFIQKMTLLLSRLSMILISIKILESSLSRLS